jgi:hypothetical protein
VNITKETLQNKKEQKDFERILKKIETCKSTLLE